LIAHGGGAGKAPPDIAAIQLRCQVSAASIQSLKGANDISLKRIISETGTVNWEAAGVWTMNLGTPERTF
jgi:hypothetical protein